MSTNAPMHMHYNDGHDVFFSWFNCLFQNNCKIAIEYLTHNP